MATSRTNGSDRIAAVEKALNVLEALWQADGAGVTELSEMTGLAKSTVHAHLSTLQSKGYVVQENGEYRLSFRFLSFGEQTKRAEPLYDAARRPIAELAERTGERVMGWTEQNGLGTALVVEEGSRSLSFDIGVGDHTYLHSSAAGKAMLAHFSREKAERVIDEWGLPESSEATITDRDVLEAELSRIRESGIAYNRGEYRLGVNGIGAPILGNDGTVHGAVSLVAPERRLESEWDDEELRSQLLAAANTVQVNLMFG